MRTLFAYLPIIGKGYLCLSQNRFAKFRGDSELVKETARLIWENNVIGWFQGRMEWGPRALGSRSILSNSTNRDMQEILNTKVKHRERFRPFAPLLRLRMRESTSSSTVKRCLTCCSFTP